MSINGVSASALNGARAASSDGVDDFGLADGPQDLPEQEQFGIAMVFASSDTGSSTRWFSAFDGIEFLELRDKQSSGPPGALSLNIGSGLNNVVEEQTDSSFVDSTAHLVVINIDTGSPVVIDFFVDDMITATPSTRRRGTRFNSGSYDNSEEMVFSARNNQGSIDRHKAIDMPFIEFNGEPYSQQGRLDLKQRAPGL
jgi:hypothetical protein